VKIGLERIDMQEEVTVETLLDSRAMSRLLTVDFIFIFSFHFIFVFFFSFLFLEQLRLGFISHAVTSVTS